MFWFSNVVILFPLCHGASVVTKRTVRTLDSSSVVVGGLDKLPREDISGKITLTLLKNLGSPRWKVCLIKASSFLLILYLR